MSELALRRTRHRRAILEIAGDDIQSGDITDITFLDGHISVHKPADIEDKDFKLFTLHALGEHPRVIASYLGFNAISYLEKLDTIPSSFRATTLPMAVHNAFGAAYEVTLPGTLWKNYYPAQLTDLYGTALGKTPEEIVAETGRSLISVRSNLKRAPIRADMPHLEGAVFIAELTHQFLSLQQVTTYPAEVIQEATEEV